MKTNLMYFTLALALLFAACKKEEESTGVVGVWEISAFSNSNCDDPDDNGSIPITDGCIDLGLFSSCTELEFKSDDTYEVRTTTTFLGETETETESGTYTLSGNTITATLSDGSTSTYSYNADGPTITSTYEDEFDGCTVQETYRKK